MRKFLKAVIEKISSLHRDRVANLKIYSILAMMSSLGGIGSGAATYATLESPCDGQLLKPVVYMNTNGMSGQRYNPQVDSCLIMSIFILPIGTLIVSLIALIATFRNQPVLYHAVGLSMFGSGFMQLVGFIASLSVVIEFGKFISTISMILSIVTLGLNGLTVFFVFFCTKATWYIYNAFSKQEREIFEEKRRKDFENRKEDRKQLAHATLQLANLFGAFKAPSEHSFKLA